MLKRIQNWITSLSSNSPLKLSIWVFFFAFIGVVSWSFFSGDYSAEGYWQNVRVEAHGMLFDLGILGVLVFWLNSLGEKQRRISRYQDEIDDYRGWKEPEAVFRIVGNIKRLNREGESSIDLNSTYLKGAILISTKLMESNLLLADLTNANLLAADMTDANLLFTNLTNANLIAANLTNTDLADTNIIGAKYDVKTIWPADFDPIAAGAILIE
jgi:BTB/POZ domain-containing protein KCTD9